MWEYFDFMFTSRFIAKIHQFLMRKTIFIDVTLVNCHKTEILINIFNLQWMQLYFIGFLDWCND